MTVTLTHSNLTANKQIGTALRRGAEAALTEWFSGQWQRQTQELDDLTQDLWMWYAERPETQRKMSGLSLPEQVKTAKDAAHQLLSRQTLDSNVFDGRVLYSVDAVKDALKGKSTNKYLLAALPVAMEQLQHQDDKSDRGYAEALRSRYEDGEIPQSKSAENNLVRAHKALTDEINVTYITSDVEGIGSKGTVFPNTRRAGGGHSDPTGDLAAQLADRPYEYETGADLRDHFYEDERLTDFLNGAAAQPVFDLGDGRQYRPTFEEARILRKFPQLVEPFLTTKREGK